MFRASIFANRHSRSSLVTFSSMAGPVATGLCAPAALWAVDVGQAGRLGQAEADLVDQSAVVAVVPVVPAVVEVDPVDQTVVVAVEVDPVDQPQAQARQSQTEDLS
jgi:hypothetical protein